ncbi:MAG: glucose-6-phosphate dehydrogenase assembly protein OpcA [Pyrinomonadaceae bacterium]
MAFPIDQKHLSGLMDVESIEQQLSTLWGESTRNKSDEEQTALLRARVANVIVFVSVDRLDETHETLSDLSAAHPCRGLVVVADNDGPDKDIQVSIAAFCKTGPQAKNRRLCCEEIVLNASGRFVPELASATLPLLVSDLPVFLWWPNNIHHHEQLFAELCSGADRLIIDSLNFSPAELANVVLIAHDTRFRRVGISDINWARLTWWRSLLANFYDVLCYREALENIDQVQIEYVQAIREDEIATQPLLILGWLASRLNWTFDLSSLERKADGLSIRAKGKDNELQISLARLQKSDIERGRLTRVELRSSAHGSSFTVKRSASGLHIEMEALYGENVQPGHVLPVRNRSDAQLVGREMEILTNDDLYSESIAKAMMLFQS